MAYNPPIAFYSQIDLPIDISPAKFIGSDGYYMKKITEASGCSYLWYDNKRRVIEIWGKEYSLPKAYNRLQKRIDLLKCETLVH